MLLIISCAIPIYVIAIFVNNGRMQNIQVDQTRRWDDYMAFTKNTIAKNKSEQRTLALKKQKKNAKKVVTNRE